MRAFGELIDEAVAADVTGWGFGWLDGRAIEERPPWGYARMLAEKLAGATTALDLDTGGGEIIAGVPVLPERMVVTEGWPPNVRRARETLGPRGVEVLHVDPHDTLPFPDATFDLVTSRHPVDPPWPEIARVMTDGGIYFGQHVGPASAYELIEFFVGPLPRQQMERDPEREVMAAEAAGLEVVDLRTARCRMELFDVGAVVYLLRKCVWWVPDFSVDEYRDRLTDMDALIRAHGSFEAHSTRTLIETRKRTRAAES